MTQLLYIVDSRVPVEIRKLLISNIGVFEDPIITSDEEIMIACEESEIIDKLGSIGFFIAENLVSPIPCIHYLAIVSAEITQEPLTEGNEIKIVSWPLNVNGINYKANEFANTLWAHILAEEARTGVYLERPIYIYNPGTLQTNVGLNEVPGFHIYVNATVLKGEEYYSKNKEIKYSIDRSLGVRNLVKQGNKNAIHLQSVVHDKIYAAYYNNYMTVGCQPALDKLNDFLAYLMTGVLTIIRNPEEYKANIKTELDEKRDAETKAFIEEIWIKTKESVSAIKKTLSAAETTAQRILVEYKEQLTKVESLAREVDSIVSGGEYIKKKWIEELNTVRKMKCVDQVYMEAGVLNIITQEIIAYNPYDDCYNNIGQIKITFPIKETVLGLASSETRAYSVNCTSFTEPNQRLPHQLESRMCYGDGTSVIANLVAKQELAATIDWVVGFFENGININDRAGKPIQNWPKVKKPTGE